MRVGMARAQQWRKDAKKKKKTEAECWKKLCDIAERNGTRRKRTIKGVQQCSQVLNTLLDSI